MSVEIMIIFELNEEKPYHVAREGVRGHEICARRICEPVENGRHSDLYPPIQSFPKFVQCAQLANSSQTLKTQFRVTEQNSKIIKLRKNVDKILMLMTSIFYYSASPGKTNYKNLHNLAILSGGSKISK